MDMESEFNIMLTSKYDELIELQPFSCEYEGKKVYKFYMVETYEDFISGSILLFGKFFCLQNKRYITCCVQLYDVFRKVIIVPKCTEKCQPSIKDVLSEFQNKIMDTTNIKKDYCFRVIKRKTISSCKTLKEYIEILYPAKYKKINNNLLSTAKLSYCEKVYSYSFLETFLLDKKIRGPCWLDLTSVNYLHRDPIKCFSPEKYNRKVFTFKGNQDENKSICFVELKCSVNQINVSKRCDLMKKTLKYTPDLVALTLNMETVLNKETGENKIVLITWVVNYNYNFANEEPKEWDHEFNSAVLSTPEYVFDQLYVDPNIVTRRVSNETDLLKFFCDKIALIDPDIIIGYDLEKKQQILLEKLTELYSLTYEKLGRRKCRYPNVFNKELFVGRLICDLKTTAQNLIKCPSYDLNTLTKLLIPDKIEIDERDSKTVEIMYNTPEECVNLIRYTLSDTYIIMRLVYALKAIPIAFKLTNIAGNKSVNHTLTGKKSILSEFLLLHAFNEENYFVAPKEYITASKYSTTYQGGLVLNPLIGFYETMVVLLDFRSLYPSIIQEYNICLTTIPKPDNGMESLDDLEVKLPDASVPIGVLPRVVKKLLELRREIKNLLKNDLPPASRMQYEIEEKALKIVANSIYGCLSYEFSRFPARYLAAIITKLGRELLKNTKDFIETKGYTVLYGDTDSVFVDIDVKLSYAQAVYLANRIVKDVNSKFKHIELELEKVFKKLLLFNKKKYAGLIIHKDEYEKYNISRECKGIDIVRTDWSQLASTSGSYVLDLILENTTMEKKITNIKLYLQKIRTNLIEGTVSIDDLIISKKLNQEAKAYKSSVGLPHVQVALRLNENFDGKRFYVGDMVPYIICIDGTNNEPMQRSYHPEEYHTFYPNLKIDVNYYLHQQVATVVSRICGPIPKLDTYRIFKFLDIQNPAIFARIPVESDIKSLIESYRFKDIDKPYKWTCLKCLETFQVDGPLFNGVPFFSKCMNPECNYKPLSDLRLIILELRWKFDDYFEEYKCDKTLLCETDYCKTSTDCEMLADALCHICNKGTFKKKYSEQHLYNQLLFYRNIFDLDNLQIDPVDEKVKEGYNILKDLVDQRIRSLACSVINFSKIKLSILTKRSDSDSQIRSLHFDPNFNKYFS